MPSSPFRPVVIRGARAGLSRTEVLVLVVLLLVAAGLGCIALAGYLERSRLSRAVDSARTLSTLLSQYAIDNNDVYPVGEGTPAIGKSEGIALNLLQNNFTPDASIFAVGSTPAYRGTAHDFSDLSAANMSWDFTAGANAATGITPSAPDLLPVVFTTGETVAYPATPGAGLNLPPSGNGPFGHKGVVVAYKNNSARFIFAAGAAPALVCPGFISPDFKDAGTYTQIRP